VGKPIWTVFIALLASFAGAQGTLRLAVSEDWETLDPAFAAGVQTGAMVATLFDGLMRYDYESTDVVPNLAAEIAVNDDATEFTFTLHEGVSFHDGSPLSAEDVKHSFERVVDPETTSPVAWVFTDARISGIDAFASGEAEEISGIEVVDERTVRITLDEPYAPFLFHLAMPAAHIVPRAAAAADVDFSDNPIGTGPFRFAGRVRDSSLDLEANPNYFAGAPNISGVSYRIITDPLITWQEFTAGNLHVSPIPPALFDQVTGDPQYEPLIRELPELAVFYLAMNQNFEPFDDVRVRRAVAMAIDREALVSGPYNGAGIVASGPVPPGLAGFEEDLEPIPFDPEGARDLLAEAGLENGFDMTIWTSRNPTTVAVTELIQFFLGEIGVRVTLNQVDFGTLLDAAIAGQAPSYYLSWFADYADAYNFLHPLFVARGGEFGYDNPELRELLAEAATLAELEARAPLYARSNRLVAEDTPLVFIYYPLTYYAVAENVTGILNHPIFNAEKFTQVALSE
jgi:ABC-type transport system substrate-binding protein